MSSIKRFITASAGCIVAGAILAVPSLAQDAGTPAADTLELEVVTVTARRREESMQDVPISISVVSGDELAAKGVHDAYDLQHLVPSLTMSTFSTQTKALMPRIRSVGASSFLMMDDPPVGTYFAEAVVGHPWGFGDVFYDIQSVQTLKGPQGTLFGRNTTGGAILIEPNKPDFDAFEGNVKARLGNFALRQINGVINLPFNDVVAVRLAAEHKQRDGYTTNILSGQKRDGSDYNAGRFQLTLRPTENITSNTIVDYLDEDTTPPGQKVVAVYGPNGGFGLFGVTSPANNAFLGLSRILNEQNARDPWDIAQVGGSNFALPVTDARYAATAQDQLSPLKCVAGSALFVANHYCRKNMMPEQTLTNLAIINNTSIEIGSVTLKNIYSYRTQEQHNEDAATFPFGSPNAFTGFAALGQPQASIAGGGQSDSMNDLSQVTEELQLQGRAFGDKLDWVTGLFYMREWGEEYSTSYTNGPTWSTTAGSGKNVSKGVYLQGTYAWTDKLNLTLGARNSWDERTAADVSVRQVGAGVACQTMNFNAAGVEVLDVYPNCLLAGKEKWDALSYSIALDYQLTEGAMVYLLRSRGYKAGGFSLRARRPSTFSYDPEYMDNTEVGVKSDGRLFDRPLRTNLSVFRMDYTDQQLTNTVPNTNPVLTFVDNLGKSRIVGAELEVSFRPTQGVDLSAFVSYNDADFLEWENNIGTVGGVNYGVVDLSHRPVGYYSKYKAGLSASWTLALGGRGDLSLRADAAYHSEWLTDNSVAGLLGTTGPAVIPSIAGYTMVPQDAYTIGNLRADWTNVWGGPMDLSLFVTNVSDEDILLGGAGVNGVVTAPIGPPRMYGIELTYRFGGSER